MWRAATTVRPISAFGDEALQPHVAGSTEQIGSDCSSLKRVDEHPVRPAAEQPFQVGLAHGEWQWTKILAFHSQNIECAKLNFAIVLARVAVVLCVRSPSRSMR